MVAAHSSCSFPFDFLLSDGFLKLDPILNTRTALSAYHSFTCIIITAASGAVC